jgi:hypothetical protein
LRASGERLTFLKAWTAPFGATSSRNHQGETLGRAGGADELD